MAAELGAEGGAGVQGPLRWAQTLVGGTGLAQCPVALGQLGQCLGIQQGLAAGGHGRGHSWRCKDSRAVGITVSSLCSSAQATPASALGWVGREHHRLWSQPVLVGSSGYQGMFWGEYLKSSQGIRQ